jgi:hypothetical protein
MNRPSVYDIIINIIKFSCHKHQMRFLKLFDFHGGKILFLSFTYSNFFLIVSIIILNHLYLLFCKLYVQLYYIILYYIILYNKQ